MRCRRIPISVERFSEVLQTRKNWKKLHLFGKRLLPVCQGDHGLVTYRSSDVPWTMAERQ